MQAETSAPDQCVLKVHPDQVAGHGNLLCGEGRVFKPIVPQEAAFYQHLNENEALRERLRAYVPQFYGIVDGPAGKLVAMEDLTAGCRKPCVLDIKLGTFVHTDDMSPEKIRIAIEKSATSTSASMGVRICGLKVYKKPAAKFDTKDKSWGKRVKDHNFTECLREFFDDGERIRLDIVRVFLGRCQELLTAFPDFNCKFIASSVLFVYDGDGDMSHMKMIDFAHTLISDKPLPKDEPSVVGYILGLRSLIGAFNNILKRDGY